MAARPTSSSRPEPTLLRYQAERTLDRVPAYEAGLQLRLTSGQRLYLAVSPTELALYFEPDYALHYDLAGRLQKVSEPNRFRRRSLSHRVLLTERLPREAGGGLARRVLPEHAADELTGEAHQRIAPTAEEFRRGTALVEHATPDETTARQRLLPLLLRAARFDVPAARADAERFQRIYGRVAVLPPDQYNALVLQATEGCAHARCLFCTLYRGVPFRRKTAEQFRQHIAEAIAYHGEALRARRSIFLGEANALTLPQRDLLQFFHILHEHFQLPSPDQTHVPARWWLGHAARFDGVCSFLDAFLGPRRSEEDFRELRRLGLRRVYVGMETGDDALLRWLRKPATAESIARTVRGLKAADLAVGLILLLGAGGEPFHEAHVQASIRLLNDLPLGRGDYIYFSPLRVEPRGRYASQARADRVLPLSESRLHQQEAAIRDGLRFDPRRGKPYLARYELETFLY